MSGSSLTSRGSTRRWREIRERVLRRDRGICQYCGKVASTVDHRVPRWMGGDDRYDNLVACCEQCQHPERRPVSGGAFFAEQIGHAAAVPNPPPRLPVLRGERSRAPVEA